MALLKVAPRVEKTKIFKKRLKFCKSYLYWEMYHEKTLFFIIEERNGVFSFDFTMKLFSTALNHLTAHSILNFPRTFLYFYT